MDVFCRVALDVGKEVVPAYSHRFSPQRFTQPQLLAILCLMRDEDWTFRRGSDRSGGSFSKPQRGPGASAKEELCRWMLPWLAPGAISPFFIPRREPHGGAAMPWRYWLKWLLVIDRDGRLILAPKAHRAGQ
jgi:hypothetical protein